MKKFVLGFAVAMVLVASAGKASERMGSSLDKQEQVDMEYVETMLEERVNEYCANNTTACTDKSYDELVQIVK